MKTAPSRNEETAVLAPEAKKKHPIPHICLQYPQNVTARQELYFGQIHTKYVLLYLNIIRSIYTGTGKTLC